MSEIDKKLAEFDATHQKSAARQAEHHKYQRIYRLRDVPTDSMKADDEFWK